MFTSQGIVDTLVGPLIFLVLFKTAGLDAALIGAGAAALAVVGIRRLRGQPLTSAWYGVAGVLLGAAPSKATRGGNGHFLPQGAGNALYGAAFFVSGLFGTPPILLTGGV